MIINNNTLYCTIPLWAQKQKHLKLDFGIFFHCWVVYRPVSCYYPCLFTEGEVAVEKRSGRLRVRSESRSDQISFSFTAPSDGVCIHTDLVRFIEDDAASISFRLECRNIKAITDLDTSAPNTTLSLSLTGQCNLFRTICCYILM